MNHLQENGTSNRSVLSSSVAFHLTASKQDSPVDSTLSNALDDSESDPETEDTNLSFVSTITPLPKVHISSLEEDERLLISARAKLFRFVKDDNDEPPEQWQERGVGDIKILQHNESGAVRILMRRDKTLKICANHYITMDMNLKPHCGSDQAFVWSSAADFSDGEPTQELLAAIFKTPEIAARFKKTFDEAKKQMTTSPSEICFRSIAADGSEVSIVTTRCYGSYPSLDVSVSWTSDDSLVSRFRRRVVFPCLKVLFLVYLMTILAENLIDIEITLSCSLLASSVLVYLFYSCRQPIRENVRLCGSAEGIQVSQCDVLGQRRRIRHYPNLSQIVIHESIVWNKVLFYLFAIQPNLQSLNTTSCQGEDLRNELSLSRLLNSISPFSVFNLIHSRGRPRRSPDKLPLLLPLFVRYNLRLAALQHIYRQLCAFSDETMNSSNHQPPWLGSD